MFRGNNFARQEKERVRERLYNQIGGVCVMMEMMVGELQEHPKRYCSIQYKNLFTVVVFSMCTKLEKERERDQQHPTNCWDPFNRRFSSFRKWGGRARCLLCRGWWFNYLKPRVCGRRGVCFLKNNYCICTSTQN